MKRGNLVISVDTSGSIGTETIRKFYDIIINSIKHFDKIYLLYHHSSLYKEVILESSKDLLIPGNFKIQSGGTSHKDVLNRLKEINKTEKVSMFLCLTDYESDFTENYKRLKEKIEKIKMKIVLIEHSSVKVPEYIDPEPIIIK